MNNIIKDLSTLTTIPELNLQKLFNLMIKCISHGVVESVKNKNDVCVEDIGIGTLSINIDEDSLQFKFIPSSQLQTSIYNSLENKNSELVADVERILQEKIINTYKTLL